MDALTKWTGVWFPVDRVFNEWNIRLKAGLIDKRFDEIHAASLFSMILGRHKSLDYFIGFQIHGHSIAGYTIGQLFDLRPEMDRDIDIIIAPSRNSKPDPTLIHPVQVVRYYRQPPSNSDSNSLLCFLHEKKFRVPKDDKLLLLVHLQQQMRINYLYVAKQLQQSACPYGQVFLMGKYTPEATHRWFCALVHPEAIKLRDLDFSFLDRT